MDDELNDTSTDVLHLRWRGSAKWLTQWSLLGAVAVVLLSREVGFVVAAAVAFPVGALTLLIRSSLEIGPAGIRFTTTFARPLHCAPSAVAGYFVEDGSVIDTPRRVILVLRDKRDGRDGSPTACIELLGSRSAGERADQITAALERVGVRRLDDVGAAQTGETRSERP